MRIILPAAPLQTFAWNADAVPPSLPLSTDVPGPHKWSWTLTWKSFTAQGSIQTPDGKWDASVAASSGGGVLNITAQAGTQTATASLKITGTNPSLDQVAAFLTTQPNGPDFNKILQHESHARNFNPAGEPIESFDHGFGMCQLTNPKPTFVQAWNWHANVQGGLVLFAAKRAVALKWLSQGGRTFTPDQLLRETISLWNGGHYHAWSGTAWIRSPGILCDLKTGNIGWNMANPANAGKTADQLHTRDAPSYSHGPKSTDNWGYFGVCYADRILG